MPREIKGDYGEIYISTVVNHEGKPTRVLLEIDEEKDYDDEEELDT